MAGLLKPALRHRKLIGAFGLYAALSVLMFGRDVLTDPNNHVVGDDLADKTLYMWSFKWWPQAVWHLHNPLDVDVAWMPHGFDFGLGTAGGGLALIAAPLTAAAGPVRTYNVLILLAPALGATTAFLLAHAITGAFWPSFVAGYVFGFSSYELGHMISHLPLAFVALVPLVPYLVLLRHQGRLSARWFVAALTGVLGAQFMIVTQIFFSLVVVGAVGAALAVLVYGWDAVQPTLRDAALALVLAVLVLAPILVYALVSHAAAPVRSPFFESADLLNYVVPTRRTWLRPPGTGEIAKRFTATGAEQGAYLGLPFLALVLLAAVGHWRARSRRLLLLVFAAAVVLSLGTRAKVAGHALAIAPWTVFAHLPVLRSALPARITLYTALFAALLIAVALTDRRSVMRWLLVAAGVAATLPNLQLAQWSSHVPRPAFFAVKQDRAAIPADATALVLPYGPAGWSMLWHAEAAFRFRIVGGHFALRVTPEEEEWRDVYEALGTGRVRPGRLCAFLDSHDVDVVVVAPGTRPAARLAVKAAVHTRPEQVLDTIIYRVGRSPQPASTRC